MLGYLRYIYAKRGVIAVATTYYLVLVTFLTAYTHPARAVTVTIDTYDEAELELAFMLLSLPAAARFLLDSLKHPNESPTAIDLNNISAPAPIQSSVNVSDPSVILLHALNPISLPAPQPLADKALIPIHALQKPMPHNDVQTAIPQQVHQAQ